MTPEFERVVLPALGGIVIAAYRLTRIFRLKVLDIFREISRDIIMFSLLMFWLASNVSLVGLNLATDIPFQSFEDANLLGFVVAVFCLGFEGFLLWVKRDLQQTGRSSNLNSLFQSFLLLITPPRKEKTLDAFLPSKPMNHEKGTIHVFDRANEILDSHFSLKYRGRKLKASSLLKALSVCFIILMVVAILFIPSKGFIALVPAYSVELSLAAKSELPASVTIITSDKMNDLSVGKFYSVPIISVQYQNGSFEAPLSDRLLNVNSSTFSVLGSDKYLLIHLTKIAVEMELKDYSFRQTHYNHTDDDSFNYIGFNREAEIFYCMNEFGYNHIVTFSSVSGGEIINAQKLILGNNTNGETVFISIFQRVDIFVAEDYTQLTSLDSRFMNQTVFLINQTKVNTNCISQLTEPTCPFRILYNGG